MRLMLTSCGLETDKISDAFLTMLEKDPRDAAALFIPTAAVDADAVAVLPKCMNDLLKSGIRKENIRVFDLHRSLSAEEVAAFDVVYLCGGRTAYLLSRINDTGFRESLLSYIRDGGFVIGVSAGSLIFADNLPDSLGLLKTKLDVHCAQSSLTGAIALPLPENLQLSNTAAMLVRDLRDDMEIIDG